MSDGIEVEQMVESKPRRVSVKNSLLQVQTTQRCTELDLCGHKSKQLTIVSLCIASNSRIKYLNLTRIFLQFFYEQEKKNRYQNSR